ncbi:conserved hypothetical protein [Trichinella spiralis]|uniref:hypothetical protein n=1 Tax=Trichinella spiralis TaxID=6334 RepID=UPI0001EFB908|nr:conserved hypothetical protein [Trichinella spiralis]
MSMLFYLTESTFIYIYNEHAVLSDSNLFYSLSLCTAAATRCVLKMRDDERNSVPRGARAYAIVNGQGQTPTNGSMQECLNFNKRFNSSRAVQ